jgi:hypothetical protein
MAKLELKYRWAPVANFLLEALAAHSFTGIECRVLMVLIRETYGWKDEEARGRRLESNYLPQRVLFERIGTSSRGIRNALDALVADGVVIRYQAPRAKSPGRYGINSKIDQWRRERQGEVREKSYPGSECNQNATHQGATGVPPMGATGVPLKGATGVPLKVEPECHSDEPQSQTQQGLSLPLRNSLRERSKRNSLKRGERAPLFSPIRTAEEAKGRKGLSAEEALWQAEHYLATSWSSEASDAERASLAKYLDKDLEPRFLLANLISATDETIGQNLANARNGLNRYREPIAKSIDTAKASLAEKLLELKKRPPSDGPALHRGNRVLTGEEAIP